MKAGIFIGIIAVIYLLGFFSHAFYLKKTVYGDGIYYYSWLRSVVIDHDIDFSNDYKYFGATQQKTASGLLGNVYAIGPAILWAPTFLWMHSLIKDNGFSLPYQIAVGTADVLYVIAGLIILQNILKKIYGQTTAYLTIISLTFATNLFFYGSLDTVNSHGVSFFISVVFLSLIFNKNISVFFTALVLGFLALIRQQDLIFGILIIPQLNRKNIALFLSGLFIAFSPQLLAWQAVYGQFWHSPYLDRGYGFDFLHPQILQVLFSPRNGLLFWTPMVGIGILGIFFKNFPKSLNRHTFVLLIAIQIFLVSSWTTWWQGASFSGRMFISLLPILSLGFGAFYQKFLNIGMKSNVIFFSLISPLIFANMLLIIYFLYRT